MGRKSKVAVVFLSALVLIGNAWAASKSDFEQAARSDGCSLIPYSDLESSCRDHYAKQRQWCTGDREKGCGDLKKDDPKIVKSQKSAGITQESASSIAGTYDRYTRMPSTA